MAWTLTNVTTAVDLSAMVDAQTLVVMQRAYAETSRLSAQIRDEAGTLSVATEHEILLTDGAVKHFAGLVRVLGKKDTGVSGQRVYSIECQDYTTLLGDDYAPAGSVRSTTESDSARIAWLFTTFGTKGVSIGASVQTLRATMPSAQDFSGLNLHQCLTLICGVTGGSFYVDYDKVLHYFSSEVNAAPFGLSDNPNGSTTFGYEDFEEASDTVDFVNEVHVIYATGSTTRYLGGSPPGAGTRRGTVLNDSTIPDLATAQARGDALLATYGVTKKPSRLKTYKAGLKAGQYVQVTHAGWSISAVSYRIAGMSARPDTKDRIAYEIDFGSGPVELGSLLSGVASGVATANAVAQQAAQGIAQIADLSVGGANLVPNSSFEDGSSWSVGSNWAIGLTPGGGQLPFHGLDVARAVLAAQTAGNLQTPKIAVDRNDEYVVSFWHFVRSRSSGTFRAQVKEYNAALTLLATTNVDFSAVDTAWTRQLIRFAPAAAIVPAKIAWQATTTSIEIVFLTTGSSTMTIDVDGVQLERGEAPTAYAPAPGEILAGTIGTTQIADDAITTPKLIASAITAAKIAAGTITGDRIAAGTITANLLAAGAITLYDEYGATLLTPSGFAGAWFDFVSLGLYNARCLQGTVGTIPNGRTSALPYWTVADNIGTPTLSFVSGGGVRATFSAFNTSKYVTSDPVPVVGGENFEVYLLYKAVWAAGVVGITAHVIWRDVSGTIISTDAAGGTGSLAASVSTLTPTGKTAMIAPVAAVTAEVRLTFSELSVHSATNSVTCHGVVFRRSIGAVPAGQHISTATNSAVTPGSGTVNNLAIDDNDVVATVIQDDDLKITGIVAPPYSRKRILSLANRGTGEIVFAHADAGSSAANRFVLPGGSPFAIQEDEIATFIYGVDGNLNWRLMSGGRSSPLIYTPTVTNFGTATFTTREGWYYRVGKLVHVRIVVSISAVGTGGGTLAIGLPTTADSKGSSFRTQLAMTYGGMTGISPTGGVGAAVRLAGSGNGASVDRLYTHDEVGIARSNLTTASFFNISGWYEEA